MYLRPRDGVQESTSIILVNEYYGFTSSDFLASSRSRVTSGHHSLDLFQRPHEQSPSYPQVDLPNGM
ncbi:hypothetical protein O9992_30665 [Vibrio lentus]|nr:hypothetical protein [Vibrio lentus]